MAPRPKPKTPRRRLIRNQAYVDRLKAEGWRRVYWLASPADLENIARLLPLYGGNLAATMEAVLAAAAGRLG